MKFKVIKFKVMKVIGNSMHPTLESGAFVLLCHHAYFTQDSAVLTDSNRYLSRLSLRRLLADNLKLEVGDIVAVDHPKYGHIIKRITQLEYSLASKSTDKRPQKHHITRLRLKGDNYIASTSEAAMGWVEANHLIGKVVYQLNR
ncbi:MAG: S26 family signal peptidase [Psychrobacter sp.]|uniref:S26 family signal peptidase n=1 Tax=Psychrobacter sp. AOP7-B1-24 TaxID=3457645 RepID=UPI003FB7760C